LRHRRPRRNRFSRHFLLSFAVAVAVVASSSSSFSSVVVDAAAAFHPRTASSRPTALVAGSKSKASSARSCRQQLPAAAAAAAAASSSLLLRVAAGAATVEAPTKERTDRKTGRDYGADDNGDDDFEYPDLEYLQDTSSSREMDDPFHILLLGSTFEKPKITVTYVSGSLEYVLNMPFGEAKELSKFAQDEGMSCLGTWPREQCLDLGKQLQVRDIVCRVVPYCEGGQRGWQAKDANDNSNAYSSGGNSNNQ